MILKEHLIFYLSLPFIIISYIVTPFTNDVKIFQGVARLVDSYGAFPMSLDMAWEIKPLGNRLVHYFLYKMTTLFTDFGTPLYPVFVKLSCVLFAGLCCWYFARSFKVQTIPIFIISFLAMLVSANFVMMQAEWFSVLVSLLCIGLLLRYQIRAYVFAGMLMMFLFLLKGITGLLIVPVVCFLFITEDNPYCFFEKMFYTVIGFLGAGFLFLGLCLTVFPYAIPDMMMAASLARVGMYAAPVYLNSLFDGLKIIFVYIPALLCLGAIGFYQLATITLPKIKYAALLLMWVSACAIVYVQGEFFPYHYAVLVLPGILSCAYELVNADPDKQQLIVSYCSLVMVVLWVLFNSFSGQYTLTENDIYIPEFNNSKEINSRFDFSSEPDILFLDPGSAPYFFKGNSTCRYVAPLPVQRHRSDWNLSLIPAYAQEYSCIMSYQGKYIITLDAWFGRGDPARKEIYEKIDREYDLVFNKSWDVYSRKPG